MGQRTIVAIGAHPDDVALGAGAALATLAAAGNRIAILTLSSGELGGDPSIREQEDSLVAVRLGAEVAFGRLTDGGITRRNAFRLIERAIAERRPDIVFVHDPDDTHEDHVQTARAALAASRDVANVLLYEGPSSVAFRPNVFIDAGTTWGCKADALRMYESQAVRRLHVWAEGAARFRAWPRNAGGRSEAFRIDHSELGAFVLGDLDASRGALLAQGEVP